MVRLLKSFAELLGYLGRGATPVDGYFIQHTEPAAAACGTNSCTTAQLVEKKFRAGYRVLM
jgi:hypothetical protein